MFDISGSELLILAVLALLLIGPKELPAFLRTIGRYMGVVKRHAAEFRAHFDEAMREAELDALRRDAEQIRQEITGPLREASRDLETGLAEAARGIENSAAGTGTLDKTDQGAGNAKPGAAEPALPLPPPERPAGEQG